MERFSPMVACLFVALLWAVSTGVACVSPQSSEVEGMASLEGGGTSQSLQLAWSVEPGDESLLLQWDEKEGLRELQVHYRFGLPGHPWDGEGATNGESPLSPDEKDQLLLEGLKNGHVVYVAISAVSPEGERLYTSSRPGIPERERGTRVWIPPGVFTMGSSPGLASEDEEPAHPVYVDGFWMDEHVTTNGEFRACVAEGVCAPPARLWGYLPDLEWVPDYFSNSLYDDFPVVFLQFQEARDYCGWRGMRLPTEAEWERAARGSREEVLFPWGEGEPTCAMANYNDEGVFCEGGPLPVGSFGSNVSPYGVREMGGNVWEWTSDWYGATYYQGSPCENPQGPSQGEERVLRGGAWYYDIDALRVTYRNTWSPTFTFVGNLFGDYRGFGVRCVVSDPTVACSEGSETCTLPASCDVPLEDVEEEDTQDTEDTGSDTVDGNGPSDGDAEEVVPDGLSDADGQVDGGSGTVDTIEDVEVEQPCINPQEVEPDNLFFCFDPFPGLCPSGWGQGCQVKACHCSIGVTADPGECGDEVMTVTAGWRDYQKNFTSFEDTLSMEVCEGFQGGVHLAAVFKIDAPQMGGDFFYGDVYATLTIGDVLVGSYEEENVKLDREEDGLFQSKLEQVRFEGCLGDAYAGETATLEVLVRDQDGAWGHTSVEVPLVNDVEGPYLDPGYEDPC